MGGCGQVGVRKGVQVDDRQQVCGQKGCAGVRVARSVGGCLRVGVGRCVRKGI